MATCLCGSKTFKLLHEGAYDYVTVKGQPINFQALKCLDCKLVVTNPAPFTELIFGDESELTKDKLLEIENEAIVRSLYRSLSLKPYLYSSSKVLDIGCGTGTLVEMIARRGVKESIGVDLSLAKAEFGISRQRDIRNRELHKCNFPSNYFDIVQSHHFLEHIPNLHELVNEVFRILKPEGLFYVSVPRYNSIFVRYSNWPGWYPQEHFWHFTEKTLISILTEHKFQVLDLCCPLLMYPLHTQEYDVKKNVFSSIKQIAKTFIKNLKLGDELVVLFQKVS